jgi:hypothetical protein
MTSLAFILGVLPLAVAVGAGAEMRQSLGTAVFFGMLGVTLFGLIFTPVFYVLCQRFATLGRDKAKSDDPGGVGATPQSLAPPGSASEVG